MLRKCDKCKYKMSVNFIIDDIECDDFGDKSYDKCLICLEELKPEIIIKSCSHFKRKGKK